MKVPRLDPVLVERSSGGFYFLRKLCVCRLRRKDVYVKRIPIKKAWSEQHIHAGEKRRREEFQNE